MEERTTRGKCLSLSSLQLRRGFPRGKYLRAEALGWDGWKDSSLEANQSFPRQVTNRKNSNMNWFRVDGLNLASFSSRKWATNQSPIHMSTSRDESWLVNEANITMSSHPSNSLFESSLQVPTSSKAVFTVSLPSTQILIVNSVSCRMLGYSAEELSAMTLQNILAQSATLGDLTDPDNILFATGNVIELKSRDGQRLPVFLFLKKIDTPLRCVAVAELVDRRLVTIYVDEKGNLEGWDEEVPMLFHYENSELHGIPLTTLIPSIKVDTGQNELLQIPKEQLVTGRTKTDARFPLCARVERCGLSGSQVVLWIYSNLTGLIILNHDLTIANCNHQFTSLLFGYTKESLLSKSILKLIPNFCEDGDYGRERTFTGEKSENSKSDPIAEMLNGQSACEKPENFIEDPLDSEECLTVEMEDTTDQCIKQMEDLLLSGSENDPLTSSAIGESDFDLQNKITEKLSLLNSSETNFRVWTSESRIRNSRSDDILAKPQNSESNYQVMGATSNLDLKGTGLQEFPMNRALNVSNLSDLDGERAVGAVRDGTYAGLGRHEDGSDLDIAYRVKAVRNGKGWCVCVGRDPWELAEGGRARPLNLTITSSVSVDGSITKESDIPSRPTSASIISQSDDVLTSGEYSEFYTNLQQIGKGAFGYVKMAYRNSDGLLVITKFIKKNKINVRSWVLDPGLKMKVPLEISLLTTLDHPNIVRVLDVFHNDAFFQIVMEKHGAGLDLFEFIDRKPSMDEKLISYIFRQMVAAVHYLHSLGILHRDIKDENVIINEVFHIKLIDFGSAAFMSPDRLFSSFYGTVEFCSPEVLEGNKYRGPELEVWALGVTLYILVFGENPFYDVEETIKGKFLIPRPLSSGLFSLLNGMLEKDMAARWDMDRIYRDPWVNQSVDINCYNFEDVVQCYHDEAYPVNYISEFGKREALKEDEDDDRTVASSNSFCSLHTIENLDAADQMPDSYEPPCADKESSQYLSPSPRILMSTPRRASATKSVSPAIRANEMNSRVNTYKRYSLDLNTLKKLCDPAAENHEDKFLEMKDEPKFLDVSEIKPLGDDFENYWDANDEEFDQDSF